MLPLLFCVAANAQGLDGISGAAATFLTWLRTIVGTIGVIAIVWGGANLFFTHAERGAGKIMTGVAGLLIAGSAQAIVNMFYSTAG